MSIQCHHYEGTMYSMGFIRVKGEKVGIYLNFMWWLVQVCW